MRYLVVSPVRHNHQRHMPGAVVDLEGVEPALVARGILQPLAPAATDAAGNDPRVVLAKDGPIPPASVPEQPAAGNPAGRGKARRPRKTAQTSEPRA